MKAVVVLTIIVLFMREIFRMFVAIENNERPIKMLVPCFFACVIAVFAKFIGNLLTTM